MGMGEGMGMGRGVRVGVGMGMGVKGGCGYGWDERCDECRWCGLLRFSFCFVKKGLPIAGCVGCCFALARCFAWLSTAKNSQGEARANKGKEPKEARHNRD